MKTTTRSSSIAAVAVATVTLFAGTASATSYFDGVFNNSDWSLTTITNAGGAGSFVGAFQIPVGGNPLEYRIIRNNLAINGPNSLVLGVHMNNTAFYNPVTQGAITSINYSEDSINFVNQGGNGQGGGLAIMQGGNTYILRNPILVMPYAGYSTWTFNPASGIVASDLWQVDNAGNLFSGSNPDFSATGGIMQLGFWRGNSSGNVTSGTFNTECGIDNWHVEIVPTPGAAAVLGLGGLALARRRRG
ncbi:MAG: PEP-CTERM sorting domain-containing protein [Phycisphaerales bacterium]